MRAHRQQSTVPADNNCALHHQTDTQAHGTTDGSGDRNTPKSFTRHPADVDVVVVQEREVYLVSGTVAPQVNHQV